MIFDVGDLHEKWFAIGEENRWMKVSYWSIDDSNR